MSGQLKPLVKQLNPNEVFDNSYIHLHKTIHGERQTKVSLTWNYSMLAIGSALAIFGAWVFITPAMKAITDSERVRLFLKNCSDNFIQTLGQIAGAESFLSNCGVNYDCISSATKEWEKSLDALNNLSHEHTEGVYEWILQYASSAFKYLWTLASVIPYYMLSLNDAFVEGATTFVKHLYSLVITASLFFVQLRGIAQIQADIANSERISALLYPGQPSKAALKKFRQGQMNHFVDALNQAETAGENFFNFTSELIELALLDNKVELLNKWDALVAKHTYLNDARYQQIHNTIEQIRAAVKLDQIEPENKNNHLQVQLYYDIMYNLHQMVADKDYLLNAFRPTAPNPTLKEQRAVAPPPQENKKWYHSLLDSFKKLLSMLAKCLFIYYAANYLFSVIGYGLDAGYAMADRVSDGWKSFVFNLVNISSNLAFVGLCLPSLNDGWEILCDLFVHYPTFYFYTALHYLKPDTFQAPEFDGYTPLEKQFSRGTYALVCGLTVLACIFSGGTNARVNEVNIPKYLKELDLNQLIIDILDFHAWIFAWISSAIMNSWFTMNVVLSGLSAYYKRCEDYHDTMTRKENLYNVVNEMGSYSLSSTHALSKTCKAEYQDDLVAKGHVTREDIHSMQWFSRPPAKAPVEPTHGSKFVHAI